MYGKITQRDIDLIKTHNLKKPHVQQALAGFLARAFQARGTSVAPEEIHDIIRLYLTATDEGFDRAAKLFNAGFRAP